MTVTTVCPGPVRTEFAAVAGVGELATDAPEVVWTTPQRVAADAVAALESGKRAIVPGRLNQAGSIAGRLLPRSLLPPTVERLWNR